ncbi:MAG: FliM/FliN family flagellar motor switch protein [Chthoniobacteraceae bacterium]
MSEAAPAQTEEATTVEAGPLFDLHGARMPATEAAKVETYNFRNPGFLSQTQLRQFAMLHEKLAGHLSARLSTFLRLECLIKVTNFQSMTFGKFCEGLAHPTHITLFQVEPLRGVGVVELSLKLGLAMTDRLLGGKGRCVGPDRILSEIEITLIEEAIQLVLKEWTHLWEEPERKLKAQCIGHESSGRFLQTAPADSTFMVLQLEAAFGETKEQLQLGIPFVMFEPFVKRMQRSPVQADEPRARQVQWRASYAAISVPIHAEWRVREITLADVLKIQTGDVIPLTREVIHDTRLRLSETEEYAGTLGVQNGHLAVQLRQRLSQS